MSKDFECMLCVECQKIWKEIKIDPKYEHDMICWWWRRWECDGGLSKLSNKYTEKILIKKNHFRVELQPFSIITTATEKLFSFSISSVCLVFSLHSPLHHSPLCTYVKSHVLLVVSLVR